MIGIASVMESIPGKLGVASLWMVRGRVRWLDCDPTQVRRLAEAMNACRARFMTITATELPGDEGMRLEYLWDLDGQILGFAMQLAGNTIDSIFDLCPAVDWIEREVHEGFAVEFSGRVYEPLLLRRGDRMGVNLREVPNEVTP